MLSSLVCGNFQDEELELIRSCSSAKKSSRSFGSKGKDNKNPYADRGLDKFTALMQELDSQRQKIYTQKGSEDISLLGFVYTNSSDYKPIVVKLKDRSKPPASHDTQLETTSDHHSNKPRLEESNHVNTITEKLKYYGLIEDLRQPSYYVPVIIILIMLLLAIFGKSFAILCASAGWYMIPTTKSESLKSGKGRIKITKDHKMINKYNITSSPTSVLTKHKSPGGSPLHQRSF